MITYLIQVHISMIFGGYHDMFHYIWLPFLRAPSSKSCCFFYLDVLNQFDQMIKHCKILNFKKSVSFFIQVLHNGLLQTIPHPTLGEVKVVGPAVRYSGTPTVPPMSPPLLGQHTDQVLTQLLGYSQSQVSDLRQAKVI